MTALATLGIIQARMTSTRLPGKVLRPVMGKPLLAYLLERVRPSRLVDRWVVATSADPSDAPIIELCRRLGVDAFAGALEDVLDRMYQCARRLSPETVVRLTADCPLHHWQVVDAVIHGFRETGAEYATNSFPPLWEDGFDTEVFTFACLESAWRTATRADEREHVTLAMRRDPQRRRAWRKCRPDYAYKLSVDTSYECDLAARILEELCPRDPLFSIDDVIALLERRPDWPVSRFAASRQVVG